MVYIVYIYTNILYIVYIYIYIGYGHPSHGNPCNGYINSLHVHLLTVAHTRSSLIHSIFHSYPPSPSPSDVFEQNNGSTWPGSSTGTGTGTW